MRTYLLIYLACTQCGRIVQADYTANVTRISQVPFPQYVRPFKCDDCGGA